LKNE